MNTAEKYALLEAQMLRGRSLGTLSEESLDQILEEMDELWSDMGEVAKEQANVRAAAWARSTTPEDLGLRDRVVSAGASMLPREAA